MAADPNFQLHTYVEPLNPASSDPVNLYNRIKSYALGLPMNPAAASLSAVPAPPCVRQGDFRSIGRSPESTPYLHVRRQP